MRNITFRTPKFFRLIFIASLFLLNTTLSFAQVCGTPGADGPVNVSTSINTYYPITGTLNLAKGEKTIALSAVPATDSHGNNFGSTQISSGDLILIIQMQDATIDYSNNTNYGSGTSTTGVDGLGGTGFTKLGNTGIYEYVIATSNVPLTGGTLTFIGTGTGGGALNDYFNAAPTTTRGKRTFQIIRVPQFSNLTLNSSITTPPFNGFAGGIIAFNVSGTFNFNGYNIDGSARGFRGGYSPVATTNANNSTTYVDNSTNSVVSGKGEGIAGTPRYMWDGFNQVNNGVEGMPGGSAGRGAPANAGGGGNDHNSGGGGGGNGGLGGLGGLGWQGGGGDVSPLNGGGRPGYTSFLTASPLLTRLVMGGGGGAGDANNAVNGVKGGVGGAIILINAGSIQGTGNIYANGGVGAAGTYSGAPDGAGGGGAGGSVFLNISNNSTTTINIEAKGGNGGNTLNDENNSHGPGGGGGGGIIRYNVPGSGVTINTSVVNGASGVTADNKDHGAQPGTVGFVSAFNSADMPAELQINSNCLASLSTKLNSVTKSLCNTIDALVTYEIEITNLGSGNAAQVNLNFLFPTGINFDSATATYTLNASGPTGSLANTGTVVSPIVGGFNIPLNGVVKITLIGKVTAALTPGSVYSAKAQALYLDPTRTIADPNRRITPLTSSFGTVNTTYQTGGGLNVGGTNFDGSSKTEDDVTVIASPGVPSISTSGATTFCSGGSVVLTSTVGTGYLWSTGATTQSITVTTSGTYTVKVSNASGCYSAASTGTIVTANPLPTAYTVTGSGSYCAGGTGFPVGLNNSQTGVSYQLKLGSANDGAAIAGTTGTAINFGTKTAAGTYTVVATNTTTSCTATMTGSAIISINPLPTAYNVTGGGTYCTGGTGFPVGLNNSQTGVSYQLKLGSANDGAAIAGTTGTAINFGTKTAAGTYTVVATNTTTSCTATMTGSAIIITNPLPVAYTVTGSGSYCAGGTGLAVGLNNSQTGVSYQLKLGSSNDGAAIAGTTGTAINFGTKTAAGTYTVVATNTTTSCTATMTGSAIISINPLPTAYNVTGGGTYCTGGTGFPVGLNNSQTGVSYQLKLGSANDGAAIAGTTGTAINFGTKTAAGTYTVVATNTTTSCTATMTGSVSVIVNSLPSTPTILASGSTTFCSGGSVVLTSSAENSYLWSTGETTQSITVSTSGSYSVRVSNASGCQSAPSVATTVTVNSIPAQPTASAQSFCSVDNKKVNDLSPSGAGFKWYSTSTGGTLYSGGETLSNGNYFVSQTTNGCESTRTSVAVTINPKLTTVVTNKTICSGESYTWPANGNTYSTTNTYTKNNSGCAADEVLNLTVTPKPADVVTNKTICSGESYTWTANNTVYNTNQTGLKIVNDGCTADQILNLTVTPKPADVVTNKTMCSGETYTWSANGIDYTTNQNGFRIPHDGCTADEVLNLTVTPKPADVVTNKTICSGETYTWSANGIDYTTNQNGFRIPHNGCTADEVLNLIVTPKPADVVTNKTICSGETYTWSANGIDYTTNQNGFRIPHDGCTADEVLSLIVTPKPADIVTNKTICSGESYTWLANNTAYTSNQNGFRIPHDGCTADEVLNLIVTPKPADIVTNKTICSGETYKWSANGIDYTTNQNGFRIPHDGCTADEVLNLIVTPKPADIVTNKTICSGETYKWSANGIDYTTNQNGFRIPHDGCTADEVLNLTVTPKPADVVTNKTICSGESYTWLANNTAYTTNQNGFRIPHDGCTADEVLNLIVTPKPPDVVTNKTICSGETYTWSANGVDYTTNQNGFRIPHDGCTADEVLNLIVTPKPADVVTNKTICSGETYIWSANGIDYTTNQNGFRIPHDGCTADEVLNLIVTPKPADVVTNKTICSGETYTWSANGIDYTTNQNGFRIPHDGCTADEVLNLIVTPKPADIVTSKTICSGETYTWSANGIDYTTNQNGFRIPHDGCTADEVLNLIVTPKPADVVTSKTICSGESYTWLANNTVYTTNQNGFRIPHDGCTADEVLNLIVTPKPADIVTNKTICSGETYTWSANGLDYTTNQNGFRIPHDGCTADEVLNLIVTPKPADIVTNKTICSGETYTWSANGLDYTTNQNGFRIPHNGCTADEVLNLIVTPKPADIVTNKTICSGETYTWSANAVNYTTNQNGFRIPHDGCTADEVLNLIVTPKPADIVTKKTICSGETYTWSANGIDYTTNQNGFRIPHDGCTADEVLNLIVTPKPADVVTSKTICSGESYTWLANNTVYTTNQNGFRIPHDGCTADEVLNLIVTPKPADIVTNKTICSGETYTWSANGIDYTTNQNGFRIPHDGCTADEVLNLIVTPKPADVVTNKTICSGETYTWSANGVDYTTNQNGFRIPHNGCTADEVLNLIVTPKPADIVTNKTICSGETYTWSANAVNYTTNQNGFRIPHDGCTADEVLNLIVTPKPADIVTKKTICSGETYTWSANGIDYTTNQNGFRIPHDGCTADEVLNLIVTPKPADIVTNKTICSGETYTWSANGVDYTTNQNGIRIPHDGCTADEVLNLIVTPKPTDIVTNKTICSGETYTWAANNTVYTTNQNGFRIPHDGCTADEVLNLTVTPKPADIVTNKTICSGESYTWLANNTVYTTNQNGFRIPHDGCTADEVLNLIVTPKPADIVTSKTICSGETYTWSANGIDYTTNQNGFRIPHDGCTADEVLNLIVTPKPADIVTSKTICSGETYTWSANGIDYTTNQNGFRIPHDGCTADEVLNLTVTPKPADIVTNKTICSGETYTWSANAVNYTSNQNGFRIPHDGCTADEVLNLIVTPKPADIVTNKTICSGETYTWSANGVNYTANQNGFKILHDGCTADEVLNLTVTPKPADIVTNKTICSGETYKWSANGIDYTTNQNGFRIPHDGCTADEVLNLTVTPKPADVVTNKTICSGETYTWSANGVNYTTNQNGFRIPHDGCTADEVLNLIVTPKPADIVTNKTICSGETYKWSANGIDYTTNQNDFRIPHDGCTADEVLNLIVTPKPADVVTNKTICSGETYRWSANGVDYTTNQNFRIPHDGCTADEVLNLTVNTIAKPIVSVINQLTCASSTASVELSGLPVGTWTINPGNISGNTTTTTISGLLPGNTYNYTVTNSLGCQSLASSDIIILDFICAKDDTPVSINGTNGGTISTVFANDKINGLPFLPTDVSVSTTTLPSGVTFNADGTIVIAPNTTAGTYIITYTICKSTNLAICSSATVEVKIAAPVIDAVTETTDSVNGSIGGKTTTSLITNDTLNGSSAIIGNQAGQVTLTGINVPTGLTLNADGTITVAAGTPIGNYEVEYSICEVNNINNCDIAKSIIPVSGAVLILKDDTANSVVSINQPKMILNVLGNDTKNGLLIVSTEVSITETVGDPTGNIKLNPDGTIVLKANTPAGTYELTYQVCELNTTNCATAIVKISVVAPVIDAVSETTDSVNGSIGGKTTTSLITNDTLNGSSAIIGNQYGQVTLTGINVPTGLTLNPDGTITVAAGTPIGNYEVEYSICEVNNINNCDIAKSIIPVMGAVLILKDDTASSILSTNQPKTMLNVLGNDTKNGLPIVSTEVSISETVSDPTGNIKLNPDGTIVLKANTPAGTYELTYQVCELNTTNCATATVKISVVAPVIDAVTETTDSVNGSIGGKTTTSLITNDTLNGSSAIIGNQAGQVTLTGINVPTGLTLNTDGTITVAAETPIGNYEVEYSICEVNNINNCDIAKSIIPVTGAVLILQDDTASSVVGVNNPVNVLNVLGNDTKNGQPIVSTDVNIKETVSDPTGNIKLNPDGTIVLGPNAPAGTYELTYQVCELNTTNCATATVTVTVVAPIMTITADSYCSNDVPYVSYNVTPDNFTPNNLLTIRWIDSANNVVATQTNLPLSGNILWPGATVDSNGNGLDWPGWLLTNGQWTEGADGFENTRPSVTMEFSLNPTVKVVVNYPAATADCNARPAFIIKANDDEAGPINTNKEISTSLNIFNNDTLNGTKFNALNVVLTTIISNPNLILNADGSVDLVPKTPSGTYQLTYQICDAVNAHNCSQAVVTVTVLNSLDPDPPTPPTPLILTNDKINVDGINGELEFINVLDNDLLKGLPINISDVVFTNTSNSPYFEFNSDGSVNVKPNTPGGDYTLTYEVCEKANSQNCKIATLNVFVEVPSIAIIKTASFNDENGDKVAEAGESITYKFKITNTGNVALTQIMIKDLLPRIVISGQAIDLNPNESDETNFTAEYKIIQNDINHGSVTNQASVEGKSGKGVVVGDTSDKENNAEDRPTVLALNGCEIKVFNAFSPNGDSKNARFYIQGLECYPDNTVEIYNRWGVLVYDTDNYNNEDRVFVGISQGRTTVKQSEGLPVGTYFYILKYKDSGSNQHELSGYLYLNK